MRVLVVTVVHDPDDARIRFRQLPALVEAGVEVSYAAPFAAYRRQPPAGVVALELPRAAGRSRLAALRAARRLLRREGPRHDVVLLHDPELLLAVPGLPALPRVIWDVHEDTVAALRMKRWLPAVARPGLGWAVHRLERWAERHCDLLLAEDSYRDRFARPHPVVPNSVLVPDAEPPPPGDRRVVYLGRLTAERGVTEMIELGRMLAGRVCLELIGPADPDVAASLAAAQREGWLRHHGFVPNRQALPMLRGALAGLALLHDQPNYNTSRPTKVMEYMALGVPVVTTPNPASADLVGRYGSGVVVPFGDPAAAAEAVLALRDDAGTRRACGAAGRAAAVRDLDWRRDAVRFRSLITRQVELPAPRPETIVLPDSSAGRVPLPAPRPPGDAPSAGRRTSDHADDPRDMPLGG